MTEIWLEIVWHAYLFNLFCTCLLRLYRVYFLSLGDSTGGCQAGVSSTGCKKGDFLLENQILWGSTRSLNEAKAIISYWLEQQLMEWMVWMFWWWLPVPVLDYILLVAFIYEPISVFYIRIKYTLFLQITQGGIAFICCQWEWCSSFRLFKCSGYFVAD